MQLGYRFKRNGCRPIFAWVKTALASANWTSPLNEKCPISKELGPKRSVSRLISVSPMADSGFSNPAPAQGDGQGAKAKQGLT